METFDRYYRPSGAVPILGTASMCLGGLLVAAVLGSIYGIVCYYNPFVYFTALGAFLLGTATGGGVIFGAGLGKVRNPMFLVIVGLTFGVVALYFAWVAYLMAALDFEAVIFDPREMLLIMQALGQFGAWSAFEWTPTGWALYAFWIAEAGVVLYATGKMVSGDGDAYCEECGVWTQEEKEIAGGAHLEPEKLRSWLEAEHYEVLDALRRQEIDTDHWLRFTLHVCPRCTESNYLTVDEITLGRNGKGEIERKETTIIRQLHIPATVVEQLRTPIEIDVQDAEEDHTESEEATAATPD